MSFTTTISLCRSSSNPVARSADGSWWIPENSSSYISAIRLGVPTSPSRSGDSPMARRIISTAFWIASLSTPAPTLAPTGTPRPAPSTLRFGMSLPLLLILEAIPTSGAAAGGEDRVHHADEPRHEPDVVGPDQVRALRQTVGDRGGRAFEELLDGQPEEVADVVLPGGRQVDRIAQAAKLPEPAEDLQIVLGRLPETEPGVDQEARPGHARGLRSGGAVLKKCVHLVHHGPVARVELGHLRTALDVHDDEGGPGCGRDLGHPHVGQPADVID